MCDFLEPKPPWGPLLQTCAFTPPVFESFEAKGTEHIKSHLLCSIKYEPRIIGISLTECGAFVQGYSCKAKILRDLKKSATIQTETCKWKMCALPAFWRARSSERQRKKESRAAIKISLSLSFPLSPTFLSCVRLLHRHPPMNAATTCIPQSDFFFSPHPHGRHAHFGKAARNAL